MDARRPFVAIKRWCRSSPRRLLWALVVIMFLLEDRVFPFSSFPMYGNFPDRTYYVYLADEMGQPLPLFDAFGYRTTFLKRVYNRKVKELVKELEGAGEEVELHLLTAEQLRPAGDATLRWLVESDRRRAKKSGQPQSLRLEQVDVILKDGKLVRETRTVGHFPAGRS
jgi:hypothetical protein